MKQVCLIERVVQWMVAGFFPALTETRHAVGFRLSSNGSALDGLLRLLRGRGIGDPRERRVVPAYLVAVDPSWRSGSPVHLLRSRRR